MKLVVLITVRTEQSIAIAEAWESAGAAGVTIVEGSGLRNIQEVRKLRTDLPMFPSLAMLLRPQEVAATILLSLVNDDLVKSLQDATTALLGDLSLPNSGILFTMPVDDAVGFLVRP